MTDKERAEFLIWKVEKAIKHLQSKEPSSQRIEIAVSILQGALNATDEVTKKLRKGT